MGFLARPSPLASLYKQQLPWLTWLRLVQMAGTTASTQQRSCCSRPFGAPLNTQHGGSCSLFCFEALVANRTCGLIITLCPGIGPPAPGGGYLGCPPKCGPRLRAVTKATPNPTQVMKEEGHLRRCLSEGSFLWCWELQGQARAVGKGSRSQQERGCPMVSDHMALTPPWPRWGLPETGWAWSFQKVLQERKRDTQCNCGKAKGTSRLYPQAPEECNRLTLCFGWSSLRPWFPFHPQIFPAPNPRIPR